jgi:hypothetical protein
VFRRATASASVTGITNRPIDSIAKALKQASNPVTVQAKTPAPGRLARRHSASPVSTAATSGTTVTSRTPGPFAPTSVADPVLAAPELNAADDR